MKKSRKILLIVLSVVFALFAASGAYYLIVTRDVSLDESKLSLSEDKIELFDGNDVPVKSAAIPSSRETFRLEELDEKVKFAFVDTEDKRFYKHDGFDYRRMVKATLKNLKSRSFKEGASTISQQLIKNTHLTQEKTIRRKLKEIRLTGRLEKKYSKDEILEKYLNTIYFGHSCFGLKSAAEFYFGKQPCELTLSDAAILAGLIKSPNNYSPFKHPENCERRKKTVLSAMLAAGHVTESEKAEAIAVPLPESPSDSRFAGSYFARVFDELEEIAESRSFTLGGTIRICTYLDPDLQNCLESLSSAGETDKTYTVLDEQTHGFKGYFSTVGNIRRLPGSVIKPLLVYAPALENDLISPATPVLDEKINFAGYEPKNFDGAYSGYISVRESLSKSVNIPAVKILNATGVKKSAEYLEKMNLPISEEDHSLALALGGMKEGFTLNELVGAYSVFPCGGEYEEPGFIRSVTIDGRRVYRKSDRKTRVFSEETAYLTSDMLKTAATTGTAKKLRVLPFPIAAKTGTSGTANGNRDAYSLSFTTKDCVGVWMGNADNAPADITGGGLPSNVVLKINEFLYRTNAPEDFPRPEGIVEAQIDKTEYYVSHNIMLADDCAPADSRFKEIFKKSALPNAKSDRFSHPTLPVPDISCENGVVTIRFQKGTSDIYDYRIDRYDYVTHNTVYSGKYTPIFTDETLESGKTYVYTVTPLYKDHVGKSVELPAVTTKAESGEAIPVEPEIPPDIVNKDWWNY